MPSLTDELLERFGREPEEPEEIYYQDAELRFMSFDDLIEAIHLLQENQKKIVDWYEWHKGVQQSVFGGVITTLDKATQELSEMKRHEKTVADVEVGETYYVKVPMVKFGRSRK